MAGGRQCAWALYERCWGPAGWGWASPGGRQICEPIWFGREASCISESFRMCESHWGHLQSWGTELMILPRKQQSILNVSCGSQVFMSIIPLHASISGVGGGESRIPIVPAQKNKVQRGWATSLRSLIRPASGRAQLEPRPPVAKSIAPWTRPYPSVPGALNSVPAAAPLGGREDLASLSQIQAPPPWVGEAAKSRPPHQLTWIARTQVPRGPPPLNSLAKVGVEMSQAGKGGLSQKQAGLTASTFSEACDLPRAFGDSAWMAELQNLGFAN